MRLILPLLVALAAAGAFPAIAKPAPPPDLPVVAPDKPEAPDLETPPVEPGLGERTGSWLGRLTESDLPTWAWGLGGLLGLLLVRRLFRRPEPNDDLMGPPRPDRYRDLPRY